jgi:hypothetical protein
VNQIEKKWNETLATYRTFKPVTQKMLLDISTLLGFLAGLNDVQTHMTDVTFGPGWKLRSKSLPEMPTRTPYQALAQFNEWLSVARYPL